MFPCSLDSPDIPLATAKWRAGNNDLPKVNNKMCAQFVSMKRESSVVQQKKALQIFTSRKISTLVNEQVVYMKAVIKKKSYGSILQCPTVITFENGIPSKAHCGYRVRCVTSDSDTSRFVFNDT